MNDVQRVPRGNSESENRKKAREEEDAARAVRQKNASYKMIMDDEEEESEGVACLTKCLRILMIYTAYSVQSICMACTHIYIHTYLCACVYICVCMCCGKV